MHEATTDPGDEDLERAVAEELDSFRAEDRTPGVVVGVVRDDALVAVIGRGVTRLDDGPAPDADTVFRIASMSKSFTAATVLCLRDDGLLRLDDPVSAWLPDLADPEPDGIALTVRHLLSMSGGLPTDDPWGDRQQDLPLAELDAMAGHGFSRVTPPGTAFEYSNLGYALVGRVVAAVTGEEFGSVVRDRVLQPLGLASTGFDPAGLPDQQRLATGYVPRGAADSATWEVEPPAAHGAFSPMGGLFSSVRDLAVWVAGFLAAETGEPNGSGRHPVARASRREMSRMQRFAGLSVVERPGGSPTSTAAGYGFGLVEELSTDLGRVVQHSGGYPGFGSHMRWHPASGLGVVALGNRTYAPMRGLAATILTRLVTAEARPSHPSRPSSLAGRTAEAVTALTGLLAVWDDSVADAWFADNMDRDLPRGLRREQVGAAVDAVGPLTSASGADADPAPRWAPPTPAQRTWWVRGERGALRLDVLMSPQRPSLVQSWSVTAVVDPSPALVRAAQTVLARVNSGSGWPEEVRHDDGVDERAFARAARWLVTRYGAVSLGDPVRGDGSRTAGWRLASASSPHAAELTLELSASDPEAVTVARISVPPVTVS